MRLRSVSLLLAVLLILSLVNPFAGAVVASTIGKAGDTVKNTRSDKVEYYLRTSTTTTSSSDEFLYHGESAKILAVVKGQLVSGFSDQWYKVLYNNKESYLIVDPTGQTITTPVTPTPTATPTPAPNTTTGAVYGDVLEIARTDTQNYNVRSAADATVDNVIGTASNEDKYVILGTVSGKRVTANDSLWYEIWFTKTNQRGYILVEANQQKVYRANDSTLSSFKTAYSNLQVSETELSNANITLNSYGNTANLKKAYDNYVEKSAWLTLANNGQLKAPANKYYNVYNINAFATTDAVMIDGNRINGVKFAMGLTELSPNATEDARLRELYQLPWTSVQKAVTGGARWINNTYNARQQETIFYQKFNLKGDHYWQQYMQAVEAPRSESRKIYSAFTGGTTNMRIEGEITFLIPVFAGMPTQPSPDPANPGNTQVYTTAELALTLDELITREGLDTKGTYFAQFKQDLQAFPDITYWYPLIQIYKINPEWRFIAETTKDTWGVALSNQVNPEDRSLISNYSYNKPYIKNYTVYDGSTFVPVNEAGVSYFMDPRNFLNLSVYNASRTMTHYGQIFMFMSLRHSNKAETRAGVVAMFGQNTGLLAMVDNIMIAAADVGTSAYFLASRMQQEVTSGSTVANNARGTIDINYPPLKSDQDSVSFMTQAQQITAINTYLNGIKADRDKYLASETARKAVATATTKVANSRNTVSSAADKLSASAKTLVTVGTTPTVTPKPTAAPTATPAPALKGDVNGDGRVTNTDKVLIHRYLLGLGTLTVDQMKRADINGDGRISNTDKVILHRHLLGISLMD